MEYFNTDWAGMTLNDWIGLITTLITFGLMIWAYVYVFHPKNKDRLEAQRYIPLDDEQHSEDPKS